MAGISKVKKQPLVKVHTGVAGRPGTRNDNVNPGQARYGRSMKFKNTFTSAKMKKK